MKIALLTDGIYPYVIGGMQKHSFYLAKFFARSGVYVDLFHFNQSELDINTLSCFDDKEKQYITSYIVPFPKAGSYPGHYIRESYQYSSLIFKKIKDKLSGYDFIYTKGFSGWKLIEEKTKGLKCPPIGVKFHGYEMFQPPPDFKTRLQNVLLQGPVKWINKNADVVFSYGGKITDLIVNLGVSKDNIIEIPTGIEEQWLNPNVLKMGSIRKFIFVGRYERRKGTEELHIVLRRLIECNKEFTFEFIGPIPVEKQIVSDKVTYHGAIRESDKIKTILQSADILVCPSHSEGMPNVIMEGMASGLGIIATDVGAVSKMVNDDNGILVAPGNILDLEKSIIKFIDADNQKLLQIKNSSITKVKKGFLWNNIILSLLDRLSNEGK